MQSKWQLEDKDIDSLQLEKQIGEGSYGKVYRAQLQSTGQIYAVKEVEVDVDQDEAMKDTSAYKALQQEINILKTCFDCPQIVRVFGVGVIFGEEKARVRVVMELCDFGSVSDVLRRLQSGLVESEIRVIVQEVLSGLQYLHDNKKIHRDVKAGNILLTKQFWPKLADFGISCELTSISPNRQTMIGSPYWMAPEVIKAGKGYNSRADIWSLGITCVEMAEQQPPYFHIPPTRAMWVVTNKPPTGLTNEEVAKQCSQEFLGFLRSCLIVDPACRPSAQALMDLPFARRHEGDPSPAEVLEASLGPRLAEALARDQSGAGAVSKSWQRRSPSGSLSVLPRPASNGNISDMPVLPLEAATPSVDAYAGATLRAAGAAAAGGGIGGALPSPSQFRRWHADGSTAAAVVTSNQSGTMILTVPVQDVDIDAEEVRRRAREWVNKTVPMQTVEADDSPSSVAAREKQGGFCVWDSDEEGVATRTRLEAQPEAGAGGPLGNTPYFMQVLNKQWGN